MDASFNRPDLTGATLYLVLDRQSDGFFFRPGTNAFDSATYSSSNHKTNGTEGSGIFVGSWKFTVTGSNLTGAIRGRIFNASASDALVGGFTAYCIGGVECSPADLLTWVGSTPDALSSGKLPADVKLWQTGTPNALQSGRVDAYAGAIPSSVLQVDGSGYAKISAGTGTGQLDLTSGAVSLQNGAIQAVTIGTGAFTAAKFAANCFTSSAFSSGAIDANALNTDAANEIRNAITGGAYALQTDASGYLKVSSGTGTGQLSITSGVVASSVSSMGSGVVTATSIASGAITSAKFAAGAIDAAAIADGAIDAATFAAGAITASALAADCITAAKVATGAIDADALAADAANEIADALLTRNRSNTDGSNAVGTLGGLIAMQVTASTSGDNLTVYRSDGTTVEYMRTLTRATGSPKPVVGIGS